MNHCVIIATLSGKRLSPQLPLYTDISVIINLINDFKNSNFPEESTSLWNTIFLLQNKFSFDTRDSI